MRRRFLLSKKTNDKYLTIRPFGEDIIVSFSSSCFYKINNGIWTIYAANSKVEVNKESVIYFKGELVPTYNGIGHFTILGRCTVEGNSLSMLYLDNADKNDQLNIPNTFYGLFSNCNTIISVSDDFLPATTLANNCYQIMFSGCTSLVSAPELPATTLVNGCYENMFNGCTKLNYIKMLATDISASHCLYHWVKGVASSGTFVKNPEATWEVYGDNGIPDGWKVVMDGEESSGGQFYVYCYIPAAQDKTYTFTIDSPKTWNECVGMRDDENLVEIAYDETMPDLYRFYVFNPSDFMPLWYIIEADEDGNTPTQEDFIKIGTTYEAFEF